MSGSATVHTALAANVPMPIVCQGSGRRSSRHVADCTSAPIRQRIRCCRTSSTAVARRLWRPTRRTHRRCRSGRRRSCPHSRNPDQSRVFRAVRRAEAEEIGIISIFDRERNEIKCEIRLRLSEERYNYRRL